MLITVIKVALLNISNQRGVLAIMNEVHDDVMDVIVTHSPLIEKILNIFLTVYAAVQ